MTSQQALDMIKWIARDKIKPGDLFMFENIEDRAECGIKPDERESKFLQEVYRYTQQPEKEKQPFKQYRRPTSWGAR